jgi:hypothetical protein
MKSRRGTVEAHWACRVDGTEHYTEIGMRPRYTQRYRRSEEVSWHENLKSVIMSGEPITPGTV